MAFAKSWSQNVVKIAWNYYQYSYRNKFESEAVQFLIQSYDFLKIRENYM